MKKIEIRNYKKSLKNMIFIISLLLAYILQTSCNIFPFNIIPIIILPVVLSISMFQKTVVSCIYSLIGGVLCDMALNTPIGLSCCIFLVVCMAINLLTMYYFKANLISFVIFIFMFVIIEVLSIVIYKYHTVNLFKLGGYFMRNTILSILITEVISVPIFLFFSYVDNKLLYNNDIFL